MRFWDTFPAGAPGTPRFGEGRLLRQNTPNTPGNQNELELPQSIALGPVTDGMRAMADQYRTTLGNERGPDRLTALNVVEKIHTASTELQKMRDNLRARLHRAQELEAADSSLTGLKAKLEEMESDLAKEAANLVGMRNVAETLHRWQQGQLPPTDLVDWLRTIHQHTPAFGDERQSQAVADDVDGAIRRTHGNTQTPAAGELPDVTDPALWPTLNQTDKVHVVDQLSATAGVPEKLRFIEERIDSLQRTLKENPAAGLIAEVDKADLSIRPEQKTFTQGIGASTGVEFFSINQIIAGFTKWKEAYKEAVKAKNERKSDKFSKKVGKMFSWLPYGEDVANSLSDKVTSNQAKERKDFIDTIGTRDFGFKDLFEGDAELAKNAHSPSRFLAIFEFASQKGWLYPLMKYNFIDKNNLGGVEAFGFNIRSVVPQDYMSDDLLASYLNGLLSKSNANGSKDINDQVVAVEGKNDVESFVDIFDKAMKGFAFWKAIGIYRGALKKGVSPATSAIFAARLNYWLRDKGIQKYMNNTLLANFGGSSWNQIPFTMAYYAAQDKDIAKWANEGADTEAPQDQLTKSIILVERAVEARLGKRPNEQQLSLIVGKVLAGQRADLGNGQSISIFETGLSEARKNANIMQAFDDSDIIRTASPSHFKGSEIVLAPEGLLNTLFDIESTGRVPYQAKVIAFSQGIIDQANDLTRAGETDPRMREAANNFKAIMRRKLTNVIGSKLRSRNNVKDMMTLRFEGGKKFVLAELVNAGLLEREAIGL
jgi:hypothetical protein